MDPPDCVDPRSWYLGVMKGVMKGMMKGVMKGMMKQLVLDDF
jgi:hypothetical protein